ncbi:uncharacterized protein EKO05_0004763 [Ascochyta rabiei]|uniref:uncharacterized protein n=1 Tax=Didymella rabiei TaxID=5454 RepID=UPI0019026198|nr:uncharacterized protein EKO05_0004763 [Ascochyta rabiei]UPX14274.1 hypothetical protein EKO05_0004763 [Ascochyta rabiei]
MVWTQPRASFNNRLPNRRPSPTRTLKDIRCFECQVATPPGIHHTRHLHHDEFAPTPNRFSILAELDTSPETKWAFDFVPTSTSVRKRRGKRGSKQQRHRHTLEKTRKDLKPDGLDAICDELVALHPDDSEPAVASQEPNYKMSEGFTSSVNAVRHHWAPQFRPNSLPTSNPNKQPETLQQKSQYSQSPSTLVKDPSIDILPSNRKIHTRFSPSAFLKDLVSLNDCVGDWPPRNSSPEPTFPLRISKACNTPTIVTTATLTQPATAACRAPVLSRTTTPPFSHTVRMHLAGSTTPSSSADKIPTHKRFPASDLSSLNLCPASASTIPPTLTLPQAPTISTMPAYPPLPSSLVETTITSIISPIISRPFAKSIAPPPASTIQQSPTIHPPHPSISPLSWQEMSEGITVFHSPPPVLITAPAAFPYLFVYPPRPWASMTVCRYLLKDTAAAPSVLGRLASSPPSVIQKELEHFLDMGHANDCWCLSSSHTQCTAYPVMASTTISEPCLFPSLVVEEPTSAWRTSTADVVVGDSQLSHNLPDLQDDIESSSSDSDAVLLTPSSESSWSVFEDLMTLNQGSQPIAFDDDGWVAVSSHGQGRRSSSLSSPSASDTQVLTPDHVTNPTSPVNLLPSLPQTPLMSAYQARVSDIESKMD